MVQCQGYLTIKVGVLYVGEKRRSLIELELQISQ